ncbi:MAG: class I SAM-dependent methyltransferase [Verrucomicrobia bacterium]|nr:class I SAM-dependent methyltransferase [Verrucomicrobiota bacterium]
MKRIHLASILALALGMGIGLSSVGAADGEPVDELFRKEFVAKFRRTGLNTAPGDARLLQILVESSRAKRGVEVGSATGYGALHMGIAFERTGGHLITIDIDPEMVRKTRENVQAMGLGQSVTALEGDALKLLPTLEGEFDFVFLDAVKRDYLKYFQLISPKLKPGALVVADNVIQSAREMRDFLDFMEQSPDYDMVIVRSSMEKNDGMAICYKIR